ncbi:hypothetical protein E2C01_081357 [Portunus trituberculatus]|uniref:Uncharacterized protein n=1 Tax=Portunus trituberculatus TaxID=210409 RepID=A0A5B7IYK7_PORTR|nr:hypothetical protein [Portunus trituberculatus]
MTRNLLGCGAGSEFTKKNGGERIEAREKCYEGRVEFVNDLSGGSNAQTFRHVLSTSAEQRELRFIGHVSAWLLLSPGNYQARPSGRLHLPPLFLTRQWKCSSAIPVSAAFGQPSRVVAGKHSALIASNGYAKKI